jgi:hypothetical protein
MKMMFNGLDRPFELLNSRYRCEAQFFFYFAKHHSITLSLYIYICLYIDAYVSNMSINLLIIIADFTG